MDLIFCMGNNAPLMRYALEIGWLPGARSDHWAPVPVQFVDIDYKKPNWARHLKRVEKERPKYATVTDLSEKTVCQEDVDRALAQVAEIAPFCQIPLVVPKLPGQLALLPAEIAVGYSIPTSYGGAQYPLWELAGRRVHLLGGSPKKQVEVASYLTPIAEVMSADGNYVHFMAKRYMEYWDGKRWQHWLGHGKGEHYLCCQASLKAVYEMWQPRSEEKSA